MAYAKPALRLMVVLTLMLSGATAETWAIRPQGQALPDYDAAGGVKVGVPAGFVPPVARQSAMLNLQARVGSNLRVTYNGLSGSPRTLGAKAPLSAPSAEPRETIARGFLRENKAIWGYSDQELDGLIPDVQYTDRHNGVTHVYFKQTVDGIRVFPGVVSVNLNSKGQVLSVQGDVFPGTRAVGSWTLTGEQAARLAGTSIGVEYLAVRTGVKDDAVLLDKGNLMSPVRVTRVVYPLLGAPKLAYRMMLEKNGLEWYDLLVDASTGAILHRRNLYQFAGVLAPSAPVESNPAAPRGLVYVEHPLATVRGTSDLFRKYPFTADPSGRPRGFANAPVNGAQSFPVNPHGSNPGDATLSQILMPFPSASNPVRSTGLPLSTSPQSPSGWFIPQSGIYFSMGNNVDAKDDRAGDNELTIGQRAQGGITGDFSGPSFVYQNSWGQNGNSGPDVPAAVLTLFYVNNWYHDLLYHLGFTEAAGNFQLDNFGRGGLGNDYVFADAQDGSGTNNANFGTPPDGMNPRMQMFLWTAAGRDGTVDFDIIIHEHSHGLSNRLVGGPNNTNCLGTVGLTGEGGGMGEGWGDWFAATISDEPSVAEYATGDPNGLRTNPVGNAPTDYTYGTLCAGPPSNPNPLGCEVHGAGEFWTIVLWEMREAMINRYHNWAFPGGPTFPTFTTPAPGGLPPEGNIRSAQGRTFDGSYGPAQTDHATIENAAFAAMFRVVDAMKLSVCNPTMVTMRDSILEADRNAGGEFQDLIWRAFANRGIGMLAQSSNAEAPDPVADFTVPLTVMDCEAAGGPLPAPAFTATSTSPNTVDISITANGAVEYIILRGTQGPGTPIDPRPFVEVGRTTGTTFTDTGLDGGVTYTYRVQASRNDDCLSRSNAVSVIPLGQPVPCFTDPTFAGLAHVTNANDCQRVLLDWTPAVSHCAAAGPNVRYNVYRGTNPTFTPGAGNRIATGVVGQSFTDTSGSVATLYYYVVRAEDSTSGGGGPANGGNEDGNVVVMQGLVSSADLVNQGFSDDVDSGSDNQSSAHFNSSGMVVQGTPQRGGWFRDGSTAVAHSPDTVWHAFNPDNESVSMLTSSIITITPSSILSFFHTYQSESGFDGGVVEYALVDQLGNPGVFQDMGDLIYQNGYPTVLGSAPDNTNSLAGRRAYSGGALGPMVNVRAFLGGLVPAGMTTQRIQIRFVFASDAAQGIPPPANPTGSFLPGWYIDDITIDEPCCPSSPAPRNLAASASGDGQITLSWAAPVGGPVSQYRIFREPVTGTVPTFFSHQIATVSGGQLGFVDDQVAGGATYAYVVRAAYASGCTSGDSNIATAIATGSCRLRPLFSGLDRLTSLPQATCALTLSWNEALTGCPGATVRYNVYRSTVSTFTPSPSNAIALGVNGLSYLDQAGLITGTTYYYVVRAEDSITGSSGPANGGNEDTNLVRRSGSPKGALVPGPDFTDDLEPAENPGYTSTTTRDPGWSVMSEPTAHSASQAWVVIDETPGLATEVKNAILVLPPADLNSASTMTFWHNFDFNRFPSEATSANPRYYTGGVLEISADGDTWFDLGPHIVTGGYNGTVLASSGSNLAGRSAWVGSSDGHAAVGRADLMQQVVVDLGAAVQDPAIFNATVVPGALIRFRLGGTATTLIGGVNSGSWGVDDIDLTGLLTAAACSSGGSCAVDPLFDGLATVASLNQATCSVNLSWNAAFPNCPGASIKYNVYRSTHSNFNPGPSNDIALGVSGLTYTDVGMGGGVTYYYVVRAEDSTTGHMGPNNGGNEDDNLVRLSILPRGPLTLGPNFTDDIEPVPEPGYSTETTRTAGGWAVTSDSTAHSPTRSWFVQDVQPSMPLNTPANDSLTMPALNLTATSTMTFWHNFDFAQFLGSTPETAYQSGAVLEISDDGLVWRDLGPFITTGGYNGVVDVASLSPLAGSMAWVGSSDAAPGTRADAMHQVVVNLGAAITDPSMFNSLVLDGALIRFRMGGTFQVLIGGVQGTGWGVDDIVVSAVRSPGLCGALCTTQPVFAGVTQVSAPPSSSCGLLVRWNPGAVGCPGASLRYNVYRSTDPSFTPAPSNAVALRVVGTSYLDVTGLENGTTYYYIVRAEDSTTNGGGPANGGNTDSNLVRVGATPSGPLAPGPDFADDLEPAPVAGYSTFSTRSVGGWAITNDTTAHSPNQTWVVLDLQPSAPPNTQANDTLTLPTMNLTSTSTMTFWHNFDFARFPTASAQTAFQSGGVLEISADGVVWRDLDLFISAGGYNGVVDAGVPPSDPPAMSPLSGRRAWVGSSDQGPVGGANNPVATRTDPMQQVVVDLGAAISSLYNTATLDGARVRFRMGGTFQILTNGTRGIGWGVDDISVTSLRAPGVCTTIEPAGRADRLRVVRSPAGQITLTWDASCSSGDFDYEVYEGSLPTLPSQFTYDHSSRFCSTGGDTTKTLTPAAGSHYYLIVPRNGVNEGSYGQASSGAERPASGSSCLAQSIGTCN